mmetsp:Transcript_42939/g.66892  ORF Transcript_42939/g.66892 Transcript_42939/m.66892 type:complete len:463 (+) Transcript_42939:22-1410(+)
MASDPAVLDKGKGKGKSGKVPLPPPPGGGKPPQKMSTSPSKFTSGVSMIDLGSVALRPTATRVRPRFGPVRMEMRSPEGFETQILDEVNEVPQYVKDQEAGLSRLEAKVFDHQASRWVASNRANVLSTSLEIPPSDQEVQERSNETCEHCNTALLEKGSLRLVTYNVWFEKRRQKERAHALFVILKNSDADVICLQEVTPVFLTWLRDESWVREHYFLSDSVGTTLKGSQLTYGVIMLWKRSIMLSSLSLYALPTNMNRSALVAVFPICSHELRVATVHLESLDNEVLRSQQLERIFQIVHNATFSTQMHVEDEKEMATYGAAILAGDMNFDAGSLEDSVVVKACFSDSWEFLKVPTDDRGITMPADDCTNAPSRIDRIFLGPASQTCTSWKLVPTSMRRLGMESIGDDIHERDRTCQRDLSPERPQYDWPWNRPSDHFGLCCDFLLVSTPADRITASMLAS